MTDRVATTGTVWLGLTHRLRPVPHAQVRPDHAPRVLPADRVPQQRRRAGDRRARSRTSRRSEPRSKRKIAAARSGPAESSFRREARTALGSAEAARASTAAGGSDDGDPRRRLVRVAGDEPGRRTPTRSTFESRRERIDALAARGADRSDRCRSSGPGRTPHGNFVLSEIARHVAPTDRPDDAAGEARRGRGGLRAGRLSRRRTPSTASRTPAGRSHGPGKLERQPHGDVHFEKPVGSPGGTWTVTLDQQYGRQHTLGRLRLSLGAAARRRRPIGASPRASGAEVRRLAGERRPSSRHVDVAAARSR